MWQIIIVLLNDTPWQLIWSFSAMQTL